VLSDGSRLSLEGVGDTIDGAYDSLKDRIPPDGSIIDRVVVFEPGERSAVIKGQDEQSARRAAGLAMSPKSVIRDIRLVESGRKGFLGIGRTDNSYEVRMWQPAVVTVNVSTKARVRWTIQSREQGDETDRTGLIEWFERCASWFTPFAEKRGSALRPYLPGTPKFICAQEKCTKTCCKFSQSHLVVVWGEFADKVKAERGLEYTDFIDQYPGFHALKSRDQRKCVFVDDNNHCGIYNLRPHQCVSYPFELAFFRLRPNGTLSLENTSDVYRRAESAKEPLEFYKAGSAYDFLIPIVVYDSDCPGFTGPPISTEEYLKMAGEIFEPCRATNATVRYL
jgi:Fe-S-cluster containining protein